MNRIEDDSNSVTPNEEQETVPSMIERVPPDPVVFIRTEMSPQPYYAQSVPVSVPFTADRIDGVFALVAFVLGYLFCRWVLGSFFGWGVAVFTAAFLTVVLIYLVKKGTELSKESWFWFGVTLITGVSFALWDNLGLMVLRSLFLFCAAVYWVVAATAVQIDGKTSNYLILDGINAVFIIPFRNFINQYRALAVFKSDKQKERKKVFSVLLGIILALLAVMTMTPQLLKADSGGFSNLIESFVGLFSFDWSKVVEFLFYCVLAIPTAAYLFGLISGSAVKRGVNAFSAEKTEKTVRALRIMAPATIYIVFGTVLALYAIFIACQLPYFFSAFSGNSPEGWLSYAEYARQGFFELCGLVALNLAMLGVANTLSRKPRADNTSMKAFNVVLSLVTLLLIVTAYSKMALYINAYGLTILRVLPSVFMLFLAIVCFAVIGMQKLEFSIVRVALIAGAVLFSSLCLFDADGFVVRYNTNRYLAGTLTDYDTSILYRAGPAGVVYAVEVYKTTADKTLKSEIKTYLLDQVDRISVYRGTFRNNLQNEQAWDKIKELRLR